MGCVFIDSRCVLANLLLVLDKISIESLRTFRKKVKERAPETYIDITDDSIYCAVEGNPDIFSFDQGFIVRSKRSDSFLKSDVVDELLNFRFPDYILEAIKEARRASK